VHLLKQVCEALAEAHDVGLIHRDIKPANLMVCRRGGISDFVKLMDFGLVKDLGGVESTGAVARSAAGIVGTPLFMAPESISSPRDVDRRADIYALGAVAYYLLVAAPVFTAETVIEVCTHHLYSEPVPPSERVSQAVPPGLERIVLRCLSKDPASRFATARALLQALSELEDVEPWSEEQARAWWERHGNRAPAA
jgi:serine/threonine-protein kinase